MAIIDSTSKKGEIIMKDYCGNCDNFPYADYKENGNPIGYGYGPYAFHECPFKDKVTDDTKWKLLGCKYFWD